MGRRGGRWEAAGGLGAAEIGRYAGPVAGAARQEARATSGTLLWGEEPFLDFGAGCDRSGMEAR